jgi:hypothetical protein
MIRVAAVALLLMSCIKQPEVGWLRTDGKPVIPIQFEADETQCKGEVQKALAGFTGRVGFSSDDVFVGCMAGKGYLQRALP